MMSALRVLLAAVGAVVIAAVPMLRGDRVEAPGHRTVSVTHDRAGSGAMAADLAAQHEQATRVPMHVSWEQLFAAGRW